MDGGAIECGLTSGFMEAQCDVSVKAQTEVVVEDVNRKLRSESKTNRDTNEGTV